MSRTYKDRPDHVREADPKFRKNARVNHGCGHSVYWGSDRPYLECDLNERHVRDGMFTHTKNCEYVPAQMWGWWSPYGHDKDSLREFWASARNENRKLTKEMVDEYNSCGIIEDSYVFTVYKKNALFGGGYTD